MQTHWPQKCLEFITVPPLTIHALQGLIDRSHHASTNLRFRLGAPGKMSIDSKLWDMITTHGVTSSKHAELWYSWYTLYISLHFYGRAVPPSPESKPQNLMMWNRSTYMNTMANFARSPFQGPTNANNNTRYCKLGNTMHCIALILNHSKTKTTSRIPSSAKPK